MASLVASERRVTLVDLEGNELGCYPLTTTLGTLRASVSETTGVPPSQLWLVIPKTHTHHPAALLGGKARLEGAMDETRERSTVEELVPWLNDAAKVSEISPPKALRFVQARIHASELIINHPRKTVSSLTKSLSPYDVIDVPSPVAFSLRVSRSLRWTAQRCSEVRERRSGLRLANVG